jgi:ABC-type tungstate transport system permease subunit
MGATLQIADQRGAYALTDRATYLTPSASSAEASRARRAAQRYHGTA